MFFVPEKTKKDLKKLNLKSFYKNLGFSSPANNDIITGFMPAMTLIQMKQILNTILANVHTVLLLTVSNCQQLSTVCFRLTIRQLGPPTVAGCQRFQKTAAPNSIYDLFTANQ